MSLFPEVDDRVFSLRHFTNGNVLRKLLLPSISSPSFPSISPSSPPPYEDWTLAEVRLNHSLLWQTSIAKRFRRCFSRFFGSLFRAINRRASTVIVDSLTYPLGRFFLSYYFHRFFSLSHFYFFPLFVRLHIIFFFSFSLFHRSLRIRSSFKHDNVRYICMYITQLCVCVCIVLSRFIEVGPERSDATTRLEEPRKGFYFFRPTDFRFFLQDIEKGTETRRNCKAERKNVRMRSRLRFAARFEVEKE